MGTIERSISRRKRSQLAPDNFFERYAAPMAVAQKFMSSRQRLDAIVEPNHKGRQRVIGFRRLGDDCADRREHVLDSVVEFSTRALMLLCSLAFGGINVDTHR